MSLIIDRIILVVAIVGIAVTTHMLDALMRVRMIAVCLVEIGTILIWTTGIILMLEIRITVIEDQLLVDIVVEGMTAAE